MRPARLLVALSGLPTRPVLGLPLPGLVARGLVPGSFLTDGGLQGSPWCQPSASFPCSGGISNSSSTGPTTCIWVFPPFFANGWALLKLANGKRFLPRPLGGVAGVSHPLRLIHCLQDQVPAD